jgi:hypothetical protein
MINYDNLKPKPKEFLAVTGLTHEEFVHLLTAFAQIYLAQTAQQTAEGKPRRRQPGAGTKGKLAPMENKLLFILAYQKGYELQTFLALHVGISQPQANYWIHRLLPVLQQALATLKQTPERDPAAVADIVGPENTPPDLILDGTERRRQRPQDSVRQKEDYSGKKKAHTNKNLILTDPNTRRIVYLGPTTAGKTHDKKMADTEQIAYPLGTTLFQDTGFQGYAPAGVSVQQPCKKPKGRELDLGEKFLNGVLSAVRIVVEHSISGIKRCRIVKDVLRNTKEGFSDLIMEVACALHNLRVTFRQPLPNYDILERAKESYSR